MIYVIGKNTGRVGYISEDNYKKNPELYQQIDEMTATRLASSTQPTQPTQEPQQGFIGKLAQPFLNIAERVPVAAESVGRWATANKAEKLLEEGNQARTTGDIDLAQQKYTQAEEAGRWGGRESRLTEDKEYRERVRDPLQALKDVAAVGSWAIPGGKFAKPWVGGAVTGAMGGFGYSKGETAGEIATDTAKGALWGAGTAAVLDKIMKGVKAKQAQGKTGSWVGDQTEKMGDAFRNSVDRVEKAFGKGMGIADKIDDVTKVAREAPVGAALDKARWVETQLKASQDYLDDILVNSSKTYSRKLIQQKVAENLVKNHRITMKEAAPLVDDFLNRIFESSPNVTGGMVGDDITAYGLEEIRKQLQIGIKDSFSAMASQGGMVQPLDYFNISAYKGIRNLLGTAADGIDDALARNSALAHLDIGLSTGISKSPIGAGGIINVGGLARPLQAGSDLLGKGMQTVGKNINKVDQGLKSFLTSSAGQQLAARAPTMAAAASTGVPTTAEASMPTAIPQTQDQGFLGLSPQDIQLIQMLPASKQNELLSKLILERVTGGGDTDLQAAQSISTRLENIANQAKSISPFAQIREKIPFARGEGNKDVMQVQTSVRLIGMEIARMFEQGRLSDEDRNFYLSMMPSDEQIIENPKRAANMILRVKDYFDQKVLFGVQK